MHAGVIVLCDEADIEWVITRQGHPLITVELQESEFEMAEKIG